MKKFFSKVVLLFGLTLCISGVSGCSMISHRFSPKENGIYVKKDGTFQSALFMDVAGESYTVEGLEAFAKAEVDEYNAMTGTMGVELEKANIKDGRASLLFSYQNSLALLEFAMETQDDSIRFRDIKVVDKEGLSSLNITDETILSKMDKKSKLIVVNGGARITTEGRIVYAKGESGEIVHDKHDIIIGDGESYIIMK